MNNRYVVIYKSIVIAGIIMLVLRLAGFLYTYFYVAPLPQISLIELDANNNINVEFLLEKTKIRDEIYYLYKNDDSMPHVDDKNWTIAKKNRLSFPLDNNTYYLFLKNEDDVIVSVKDVSFLGKVTSLLVNKNKIYLALNDQYQIEAKYETIGYVNESIKWYSEDDSIASVENGKITANNNGTTVIHASIGGLDEKIEVVSTDLIVKRPNQFDRNKSYLPCNRYSKSENDLLDEILKYKIDNVGYKTRAGVVEAARFLALDFPYKINYFSENGRLSINKIDGEGRYYHIGLYLHESRYSNISKSMHGPKTWGCSLYSNPSHSKRSNGFDCSGFVSWVLLNGGFDVGDVGAGLNSTLDLTDYGERIKFNANVVSSGVVKVGDLLSSGGVGGGHIAVIVGEDNDYYYVAESLWTPPNVSVVIIGYSKNTIFNRYYYVMLMDSYYQEDGKLTKLWY